MSRLRRPSRIARLIPIVAVVLPTLLWAGSQTHAEAAVLNPASLGMRPTEGAFLSADRLASFESELGQPINWFVAMAGRSDPGEMRSATRGQLIVDDAVLPDIADRMNLVHTVPLAFGRGSAKTDAGRAAIREALFETAAGRWDADYRQVASLLVEGGYPDAVIRLGHEFTGSWYPWSAQGNADAYIAAYQHVHAVFREISPAFTFEWNGARATFVEYGPAAYPGDAYVDVVGLDVYYRPEDDGAYDDRIWNRRYLAPLTAHRDFAASHGKPVSYSEWAVGGTDEPRFIASMHAWFASLPETGPGALKYQIYFNPARDEYSLDGDRANTRATYVELFGADGTPTDTTLPATTVPATNRQFTLFDHTGTQTSDTYWAPPVNQPADYTTPVDYANGRVFVKLDMTSKPSDKAMQPLLCFWRHGEAANFQYETCAGARSVTITAPGTYWLDLGAPNTWWQKAGGYDWAYQASVIRIMFRDPTTGRLFMSDRCGAACYRPADELSDHIPLTYSAEAIFVASGSSLVPPADWTGCPPTFSTACSPPPPIVDTTPTGNAGGFSALTPFRVTDTRIGLGTARLPAGTPRRIQVAGNGTVPVEATAISANFTTVSPDAPGFLAVYACTATVPTVSTVNFAGAGAVANAAIVPLDAQGGLCFYSSTGTDVIVDVNGYVSAASPGRFVPAEPVRLFDTRTSFNAPTRLAAGQTIEVQMTGGSTGVPAGVQAVVVNLVAVEPGADGFVTAYPCDVDRPTASNLNPERGAVLANTVVVPVSVSGTVCFFSLSDVDLVGDLAGYITTGTGLRFTPLSSTRLVDTRDTRTVLNLGAGGNTLDAGSVYTLAVAGSRGIPPEARVASINIASTEAAGAGYVTLWPCSEQRPLVSALNIAGAAAVANGAQQVLSSGGDVCVFTSVATHLVIDISGFWAP